MDIAIIGGGPAGLRAAEVAAAGGAAVTLFDAKASVGRKFLVAGKGGLNITKDEPVEKFAGRYSGPELSRELWLSMISGFDSDALRSWAQGLGVETFVASTGRVYPREMKAAPLLRRWVQRLRELGVIFAMHHRWTSARAGIRLALDFETPDGPVTREADAAVLALGGGSWPGTGSDGGWTEVLTGLGVALSPLQAANCGWEISWPKAMLAETEGQPLKNVVAKAGDAQAAGELLITKYGLEGGPVYQLGPALRAMEHPVLTLDLKPAHDTGELVRKLGTARRNFLPEARSRWRLSDAMYSLLSHTTPPEAQASAEGLARAVKALPLALDRPRAIDEAISSAGGVRWSGLDEKLMLKAIPGVFCAGEMIDWEAPTGGYLMQGCFATGTRASLGALGWTKIQSPQRTML